MIILPPFQGLVGPQSPGRPMPPVGGYQWWIDPSDQTGADGSTILAIPDKSGNGNYPAMGGSLKLSAGGIGGRNAFNFLSGNAAQIIAPHTGGGISTTAAWCMAWVQHGIVGDTNPFWIANSSGATWANYIGCNGAAIIVGGTSFSATPVPGVMAAGETRICVARRRAATVNLNTYSTVGGAAAGSFATPALPAAVRSGGPTYFGYYNGGYYYGRLGEALFWQSDITDTQVGDLIDYLKDWWIP